MYLTAAGHSRFELGDKFAGPRLRPQQPAQPPPQVVVENRKEKRKELHSKRKKAETELREAKAALKKLPAKAPKYPDLHGLPEDQRCAALKSYEDARWRHAQDLNQARRKIQRLERALHVEIPFELKRTWDPELAQQLAKLRGQANLLQARIHQWQPFFEEMRAAKKLFDDLNRWSEGHLTEDEKVKPTGHSPLAYPVADLEEHLRRFFPEQHRMNQERAEAENARRLARLYADGLEGRAHLFEAAIKETAKTERELATVCAEIEKLEKRQLTDP